MTECQVSKIEVANAISGFFSPVAEIRTFSGSEVPVGVEWSVICEPHSFWRVRVAKRHSGEFEVNVSHPGEGVTMDTVYPADVNFGEVIGAIGLAVPVAE